VKEGQKVNKDEGTNEGRSRKLMNSDGRMDGEGSNVGVGSKEGQ
jgi:hypothetical protein